MRRDGSNFLWHQLTYDTISGDIKTPVFKAWEQRMNDSIVIYNENEKQPQTNKKLKQNFQPKPRMFTAQGLAQ